MSAHAGELARTALLTGAAGGIGRAIAARLAREGVHLVLAGRRPAMLQALAERLASEGGRLPEVLELDVADAPSVRRAVARLDQPVEWLVNNAGIAQSAPLWRNVQDGEDLVGSHMAVNFHGPRRLMELVLPGMRERGYGRIVNLASSAGLHGYAYMSAYCASKHALVGYSRAAALDLAESGVTVNVVCPHYVDSPMVDAAIENVVAKTGRTREEARKFFDEQNPGGRMVTPDEVAGAVCSLLAGDANGALVELDGSGEPIVREG
jgi:NAD(P)-dependent dehydrogenase (short-subunit alcohol dehydrogenase family)